MKPDPLELLVGGSCHLLNFFLIIFHCEFYYSFIHNDFWLKLINGGALISFNGC